MNLRCGIVLGFHSELKVHGMIDYYDMRNKIKSENLTFA